MTLTLFAKNLFLGFNPKGFNSLSYVSLPPLSNKVMHLSSNQAVCSQTLKENLQKNHQKHMHKHKMVNE